MSEYVFPFYIYRPSFVYVTLLQPLPHTIIAALMRRNRGNGDCLEFYCVKERRKLVDDDNRNAEREREREREK